KKQAYRTILSVSQTAPLKIHYAEIDMLTQFYKRIFLRSFLSTRNLLLCKRKNRLAGRFFEGSLSYQLFEPR
ncbi:hypothetical protein DOB40_24845, partial [Salmonella enterica subsp. enterica]|nr:hypothetical protein [Salmonella enterica subsp. enterica serovar Corvallis]EBV3102847.1 hypothetical protein [Salmonella enterica subsp. enterica serovar Corvallis]EBV4702759.1 hypothetical protein [Salmonella enterica subsp. enterica serovar Corvallis]MJR97498.1 hypothetical protein [Salmonella enterica subsp. enterica serovar Corvallis]